MPLPAATVVMVARPAVRRLSLRRLRRSLSSVAESQCSSSDGEALGGGGLGRQTEPQGRTLGFRRRREEDAEESLSEEEDEESRRSRRTRRSGDISGVSTRSFGFIQPSR